LASSLTEYNDNLEELVVNLPNKRRKYEWTINETLWRVDTMCWRLAGWLGCNSLERHDMTAFH
jgi:hypothetical protein